MDFAAAAVADSTPAARATTASSRPSAQRTASAVAELTLRNNSQPSQDRHNAP